MHKSQIRIQIIIAILFISLLFTACSQEPAETQPALTNTVEATQEQADASKTPLPGEPSVQVIEATSVSTNTPTATLQLPTASSTPKITTQTVIVVEQPTAVSTLSVDPTLENKEFPSSLIQIDEPGERSRIISPIVVRAGVKPGAGGLVSVQLFGEKGRLMSDQLLKMVKTESGWVYLVTEIKFEIKSAGESGLIVVTTHDEFDRRIVQSGVPVTLLQIGETENEPAAFLKQAFVISSYEEGDIVEDGVLHLEGYAHPFNANPITIELITETGGILESKAITLPRIAEDQDYAPFSVDIPYTVSQRTPIRLTIRQRSELLQSVDIALSSLLLYLDP